MAANPTLSPADFENLSRPESSLAGPDQIGDGDGDKTGSTNLAAHFLSEAEQIERSKIKTPTGGVVVPYDTLAPALDDPEEIRKILNKLVVLKFDGGLGTTMGCSGPKSIMEVRDGLTFLDLFVIEIQNLNSKYGCNIPLMLMNSFNTHDDTLKIVEKFSSSNVEIHTFNQSLHPRLAIDDFALIPSKGIKGKDGWYPSGHGDLFTSLNNSGKLDEMLSKGKEYVFIANSENLGASVDLKILSHLFKKKIDYCMELLDIAQLPGKHVDEFKLIEKFKNFNTNNLWVNLKSIKRLVEVDALKMEIIPKVEEVNGIKVLQLENIVGAAIKLFDNAIGINIHRSRFFPIEETPHLLLQQSDLYILEEGIIIPNNDRTSLTNHSNVMKHKFKANDFSSHFESTPDICELDNLVISSDVRFGSKNKLKKDGIVITEGTSVEIPDGTVLDDSVVYGNLEV